MEMKEMAKKIYEIEMPKEMRDRIIANCNSEVEDDRMNKNKEAHLFKKPMVAAASIALALSLTGITALATTGKLQGYFKDTVRWDGAITGQTYEQATEEMNVEVAIEDGNIIVLVEVLDPSKAPYGFIDTLELKGYEITDAQGNKIEVEVSSEPAPYDDGRASIKVSAQGLPGGSYKLVIYEFVGGAKADQPLVIKGKWVCEFNK